MGYFELLGVAVVINIIHVAITGEPFMITIG